jgi:hypothetical protein
VARSAHQPNHNFGLDHGSLLSRSASQHSTLGTCLHGRSRCFGGMADERVSELANQRVSKSARQQVRRPQGCVTIRCPLRILWLEDGSFGAFRLEATCFLRDDLSSWLDPPLSL